MAPQNQFERQGMNLKNKIIIFGLFLFVTLAESAMAVDLSGKWIVPSDNGAVGELILKADGNSCTGAAYHPSLGENELKSCRIEKDSLTFIVEMKIGTDETKTTWIGKIAEDKIQFIRIMQRMKRATATRVRLTASSKARPAASGLDLSGKWIARLQDGAKSDMIFIVEGDAFSGILSNPNEGEQEIKGGRIEGNNISFYVIRDESRNRWEGKVIGDEIDFKTIFGEQSLGQATAWKVSSSLAPGTAPTLDLSGKWVGRIAANSPRFELYFMPKGNAFTGTVINSQAGEASIEDGKIEGDAISFQVARKGGSTQWKGRISGDEIRFTMITPDNQRAWMTCRRERIDPQSIGAAAPVDLSGKWYTNIPGGLKLEMYFIAKGTAFTGIMVSSKEGEIAIKEGKIEGNEISFYVTPKNLSANESKVEWKGKVDGDRILFTYAVSGEPPKKITVMKYRSKPTPEN
jgi:hypothetical protein